MISIFASYNFILGLNVTGIFAIKLHLKDLALLEKIKETLGVGRVSIVKDSNMATYRVSSVTELLNVIIPHF